MHPSSPVQMKRASQAVEIQDNNLPTRARTVCECGSSEGLGAGIRRRARDAKMYVQLGRCEWCKLCSQVGFVAFRFCLRRLDACAALGPLQVRPFM